MRKYIILFKISLSNALVYRFDFWSSLMGKILLVLVFIFFWSKVFAGQNTLAGFSLPLITAYVIFSQMMREVVLLNTDRQITQDIRSGESANFLLKPIDYLKVNMVRAIANPLSGLIIYILVAVGLMWIFSPQSLMSIKVSNLLLFFLTLLGSILIMLQIESMIGFTAFWLTETLALRSGVIKIINFLAGFYLPLTFFPQILEQIISFTPFPYIVYFPVLVLLGRVEFEGVMRILQIQIIWLVLLYWLSCSFWRLANRRHEAVGR